jgi:hypothetical protein
MEPKMEQGFCLCGAISFEVEGDLDLKPTPIELAVDVKLKRLAGS